MKLLVIFALFAVVSTGWAQELTCEQLENQGEMGIHKMFVGEDGVQIPNNEAELETRCNDGKRLYKTLLEYKKCLKPFPQQVFGTTAASIGKLLKKNCGDAEGKKHALKLFQCANSQGKDKVKETQKCVVGSLDSIQKLSSSGESKPQLVAKMCCLAHVAADCAREKIGTVTCPDPTIKPLDHFEEAMQSLSKDTMELACEDYKTMAQCQAKIPEAVAELKQNLANADTTLKGRQLIKPLIAVAEKVAN